MLTIKITTKILMILVVGADFPKNPIKLILTRLVAEIKENSD